MFTVVPRKRGGSVLVATQTSLIFLDLKVRILSLVKHCSRPENLHTFLTDQGIVKSLGKKWTPKD